MQDIGKLIVRLTVAGLILFHGINKVIHGAAWMAQPLAALHLPEFISYGVYVGEVIAPLFVILGLWTRVASLSWRSTWSWRWHWRHGAWRPL